MIANDGKWHYLLWKTSGLLHGITSKYNDDCYIIVSIYSEQKPNLNHMRVCVRITINVV